MSPILSAEGALLLVVDLQTRLMPAIADRGAVLANAQRLAKGAERLGVPVLFTEQNPRGLGGTVPELAAPPERIVTKMSFDASAAPGLAGHLAGRREIVITGAEAHVCVLQTALGLAGAGHRVAVVADAVGSRRVENRDAGLQRMARHGIGIVTTEMVLFEWLGSAEHPRFREIVALIK